MADPLQLVELLVMDVDGVLTDGLIHIDAQGTETKTFHTRDGLGLRAWQRLGLHAAIITGRSGMSVQHRARELGIPHVFQGVKDKGAAFGSLLDELGLLAAQAAVIGDDLPDLPMMRGAGYPIAVADAASEIRSVAAFVTQLPGGHGAVREAIEHILRARDQWRDAIAFYDAPS